MERVEMGKGGKNDYGRERCRVRNEGRWTKRRVKRESVGGGRGSLGKGGLKLGYISSSKLNLGC